MSVKATTKRLAGPLEGGGPEGTTVTVEPLNSGYWELPRGLVDMTDGPLRKLKSIGLLSRGETIRIPVPVFLIRHPLAGAVLVDTGLHPAVGSDPVASMGRLWGGIGEFEIEGGHDIASQLRDRDLDPKGISTIVMTHLHVDHSSGMALFPNARFILSETEWMAATEGKRPAIDGYVRQHFDYLFDYRTIDWGGSGIGSYGTFGRTFDLFGDGSIRLAYTPGHSAGHLSVIARLRDEDFVIIGDVAYTRSHLRGETEPANVADEHNQRRSMSELRHFAKQFPSAKLVPGHDPDAFPSISRVFE